MSGTPTIEDFWRVAGTPLDTHPGSEPTVTPGASYGLSCILTAHSDPPPSDPDAWGAVADRRQTLLAYGTRRSPFDLHEIEGGRVSYTETHDGSVPNGSVVVGVQPPNGEPLARGGWYLVANVEETRVFEGFANINAELVYLAPLGDGPGEYAARYEVARDLEADAL